MTRIVGIILGVALLGLSASGALAQGSVQARVDPATSTLSATDDGVALRLSLSQPVPYRLRLLPRPPRVVMDFNTLDWQGMTWPSPVEGLRGWRLGHRGDGWARLVLDLGFPMLPQTVAQTVAPQDGRAEITVALRRAPLDAFEARARDEAAFAARQSDHLLRPSAPAPDSPPPRPLRVMLDPGHGGVDPGAVRNGQSEAAIVLRFARALRAELRRRGGFEVNMTRENDDFVSLDGRLRAARAVQADLFLSVHADALPEGLATGAAVYTLSEEASDETAGILAARHDRDDLLSGVDLSDNTDEIASVLMSVAWQDTKPRNAALAQALVDGIGAAGLRLHARPVQSGAFSVLRAPDMPSALLELGFLSSPRDLARLQDPDWRARMARAVADALEQWRTADRARRGALERQVRP